MIDGTHETVRVVFKTPDASLHSLTTDLDYHDETNLLTGSLTLKNTAGRRFEDAEAEFEVVDRQSGDLLFHDVVPLDSLPRGEHSIPVTIHPESPPSGTVRVSVTVTTSY